MAQALRARCPSCRSAIDVDPDLEYAACPKCHTQSFVMTATRPVPPHLMNRNLSVIDTTRRGKGCLVTGLVGVVLVVTGAYLATRHLADRVTVSAQPSVAATSPTTVSTVVPASSLILPLVTAASVPSGSAAPAAAESSARAGFDGAEVTGALPAEVVRRIVRHNVGKFQRCYETGLRKHPRLEGKVELAFVIGTDGSVVSAKPQSSSLSDTATVSCLVSAVKKLQFPAPAQGVVSVILPLTFQAQ